MADHPIPQIADGSVFDDAARVIEAARLAMAEAAKPAIPTPRKTG